jgi:hypothetical protein
MADEAWAIVKKDKALEAKANEIRQQMSTMKSLANIWLPIIASILPQSLDLLPAEA